MFAASRYRVVIAAGLLAAFVSAGGCSAGSTGDVGDSSILQPPEPRVPNESAVLVTPQDARNRLAELGLTSGMQPWRFALLPRPRKGWAWVAMSTRYVENNGTPGGIAYVLNAETGELVGGHWWGALPEKEHADQSAIESAETAN